MSEHNITVQGGSSVRLPTAGKYCDRDIVVTAEGGTGGGGMVVCNATEPNRYTNLEELENLEISFPSATRIEDEAFSINTSLGVSSFVEVDLPNVTYIGYRAFANQSELKYVSAPNVHSVAEGAFTSCIKLEGINAPQLSSIGESAFNSCTELVRINFQNVISISDYAFINCSKLKSVDAPKATTLGGRSFADCSELTRINIPSVKMLNNACFNACTSLYKADFPSVTSIGEFAFCGCANLTALILRTTETVCVVDPSAFDGTPMLTGQGHVYVPSVMYEYYREGYEPILNELMPGFFDILFRKIEDYPEICG